MGSNFESVSVTGRKGQIKMEKFLQYGARHADDMFQMLLQHVAMCAAALGISIVIATLISMALLYHKNTSKVVIALLGACYAIPSMAMFAMLLPIFGLGQSGPIIALVIYSQFVLTRNILQGFRGINSSIVDVAKGMGMSSWQVFSKVQLPLAMPVILGGLRIAVLVTIGSATVAQTVDAGGLGELLFEGMRTNNNIKIIWGVILIAALALACNYALAYAEKRALRFARGEAAPRKQKLLHKTSVSQS